MAAEKPAEKIFKISFRDHTNADATTAAADRTVFVAGQTVASAKARLLTYVVDIQNIERATPTELAQALNNVMRGGDSKPVVILEDRKGAEVVDTHEVPIDADLTKDDAGRPDDAPDETPGEAPDDEANADGERAMLVPPLVPLTGGIGDIDEY